MNSNNKSKNNCNNSENDDNLRVKRKSDTAHPPTGRTCLLSTGAVNLEHSCLIKTDGVTSFTGNQAGNDGGAVWAFNESEVVATGNTSFLDNTSQKYGGERALEDRKHGSRYLAVLSRIWLLLRRRRVLVVTAVVCCVFGRWDGEFV